MPRPRSLAALLLLLLGSQVAQAEDPVPAWARVSEAQRAAAERLGIPVAFANHCGMRFVLIPAGEFVMGASVEQARKHFELVGRPWPHTVVLTRPFYLQTTETTNASVRTVHPDWDSGTYEGRTCNEDEQPAIFSHSEAGVFLSELRDADPKQRRYRFPTEAEWEFACRGGTTTDWYWGDTERIGDQYEVLGDPVRRAKESNRATNAVGSRKPNPYGLHDMLGNWYEWVADRYGPLPRTREIDPQGPTGIPRRARRLFESNVVRGGSIELGLGGSRVWSRWPSRLVRAAAVRAVVPVDAREPISIESTRPLRVVTVRAESGRPLAAKCVLIDGEVETAAKDGRFDVRPRSGTSYRMRVETSKERMTFSLDDPDELFPFFEDVPGTTHFVYRVPLYRRTRVEGLASSDASPQVPTLVWVDRFAGYQLRLPFSRKMPPHTEADERGRYRLKTVPWIPGAPVVVRAAFEDARYGTYVGEGSAVIPTKANRRVVVDLELTPDAGEEDSSLISDGTFGGGGGDVGPVVFAGQPETDTGSVTVRCRTASGLPLQGAIVARDVVRDATDTIVSAGDLAITDPAGAAHFPVVPIGSSTFELFVGTAVPAARVRLAAGREVTTELRVPAPASVNLTVRRAEGGPAAWATVQVRQASRNAWHDLAPDGTLYAEPTLGHDGRRTLHNIEPGPCKIWVYWLGRTVEREVEPAPGQTLGVELELPPEEGWGPGE